MHIKKLEISGFKSFVDRTVVHFDHDVIGIVGPNGCGKSNIVDALRWCMGEQSAKHLRGRAMEDVIFSGSESRPAHGLAEVVLTFDNSDSDYASSLPLEYQQYAEIAVCRRLYRDGTSEYRINGAPVRLRDVTELFLGTGVGTKAYSIVEQGRIGQIVSARPQDRRMFLEEAAGITKYRQRRKQAERKLDLSKQNLLRLRDIVSEIDRSRASLRRQAAKAERFIRYREEVEELSLHQASHRLLELIVVQNCEETERGALAERSAQLRGAVNQRDKSIEQARSQAADVEQQVQRASQAMHEADSSIVSLTAEYQRGQDRISHLRERLENSAAIREELIGRSAELAREQEVLAERRHKLSLEQEALGQAAGCQDSQLAELQAAEKAAAEQVAAQRLVVERMTSQIATDEVRLSSLAERNESSGSRRSLLDAQQLEFQQEVEALQVRLAQVEPLRDEAQQRKQQASARQRELEVQLAELTPQVKSEDQAVRECRRHFEARSSRFDALEDLQKRMAGLKSGAKALIHSGAPAVCGLFAERLTVPAELTDAIAGLLGERLESVVSTDPTALFSALESIRSSKQGRVGIVPLPSSGAEESSDNIPQTVRSLSTLPKAAEGVVGRAVDLVEYRPEDTALVHRMLGDAVVVRQAQEVLSLSHQLGVVAVALDGTVATPDGFLTGGSLTAPQIDRQRELSELREELDSLQANLAAKESAHQQLDQQVRDVRSALDQASKSVHEAELQYVGADKDSTSLRSELSVTTKRLAQIVAEQEELQKSVDRAEQQERQVRESLQTATAGIEGERTELAQRLEALQAVRSSVAEQANVVTNQKVRLAQVSEQFEAVVGSLARVRDSFHSTEAQAKELEQSARDASASLGETAAKLINSRIAQRQAETEAVSCRENLDRVRASLEDIRQVLGEGEDELKTMRSEQSGVDSRLSEAVMKLQKLSLEHEHLLAGVAEKFRGLDLRRVVGDYHCRPAPDEEHRRRLDELGKLIDRMGSVNLDAQKEFENAETRFVELSEQVIDIETGVAELETAIQHMDRESKRRLKETFKAVNVLFTEMFQRMFGGGHAKLLLTDPDNLLETGVDIMAQPPGKKLGTVELMSGGEKALTAASLIFAIFQHRPSPFCVLDEVDAPLDEANVNRYNEAIRSMTNQSQFIVITHIKSTMQAVDLLYGVTMGEPGVSRVVSVKVNERAQSRSKLTAGSEEHDIEAAEEGAQVA